ncbi:MAG TPA: hypothetical protein VN836_00420 [Verrucomicrobiae bacterium]|nr:hypothetical protein [Verrucomicrobiae bacterium]
MFSPNLGRLRVFRLAALAAFAGVQAPAEVVFQDFFTSPAGNITNSIPWIDVEGNGWQSSATASQLTLDGSGHLYNAAASAGTFAGVPLIPIGPHGSMTASALMNLPVSSTEWIGLGFANSNLFLSAPGSGSGPWLQTQGNGTMILYGGAGLNNAAIVPNAFTNSGNPVQAFLTYDAFDGTASAGTISDGVTNLTFNQWPLTNSAGSIAPHFLVLQMSTNLTTPTARWATAATVGWIPRPPPMLTLPVPVQQTNFVGSPGTNDVLLISNALNSVGNFAGGTEIRFTAGATYVISNDLTTAKIPLALVRATNVLVNGNGCKILIRNPHLGFLSVNNSSNAIVEGFSVDYDPLPFTQGVVTHNFSNDASNEAAIEFAVDTGYPAPTNANYLDPNASRWGMVIDPTRPGRVADGAWTQVFYDNVVQTNVNGAFKVSLTSLNRAQTIPPGSHWCMISRWDGAIVFNTSLSVQVTYLNNTNYTGAGPSYVGERSPMTCEINDRILPGPPPAGATTNRLRASNADGGMFIDSRIGPWVQGCSFTGLSDDAANACLSPFIITNVPVQPTNTFAVFINNGLGTTQVAVDAYRAAVGDVVDFYNGTNGVVFDRATITAVSLPNVTFDHSISNVVAGIYDTNTLLLDETLNTSAVYLDNQFSNSAFHGIYCRANNMLIAHNTIGGMGKNAICAFPAITANFLNFFVPTNVVIMDNVLSDEGFSYEAVQNTIPDEQPAYAMIALHKADTASDDVTNGFEISGIRILYNAFLNWRRAPLTLHNATDVNVIGNYFGPPITNDDLVPLTNDVIADLWVSDYPNLRFTNNVNATTLPDAATVNEDGTLVAPPVNAFQMPTGPRLAVNLSGTNLVVGWISPSPGFVLQQVGELAGGTNNWSDVTNAPVLAGESNLVTLTLNGTITNQFYRARQR